MNPVGRPPKQVEPSQPPPPAQIIVQVGGQPPLGPQENEYGTPIFIDESCLKARGELQERVAVLWKQGYRFQGSFGKYGDKIMTIWSLKE